MHAYSCFPFRCTYFFIILKMTLRNHAGKQTTAHLQRKDAGWCGGLTHRTDAEGSYGRRPNRRATSPSAIQKPGVLRRSVTISLTSMVPKRCELSPCQASPGRSLALTPLNGYRMESQERGGEPGARQAHLSGTKGQRGVQISSQGVT